MGSHILTFGPGGKELHEYMGSVDFRHSNKTGNWEVFTIFYTISDEALYEGLLRKKILDKFVIEPHKLTTGTRMGVTLRPYHDLTEHDRTRGRRDLLKFLEANKMKIVWKEDKHGYQINSSGKILKKWKLNTVFSTKK